MKKFTLNCKGTPLYLSTPVVMGILNVTQDSFYDGGKYTKEDAILKQAERMLREGASIIDIGGMSSRPNAVLLTEEEELRNVLAPVEMIHRHFPEVLISVDTFRSGVAEAAIQRGASILNDISGGMEDEQMFTVAATHHCPYILMHRRGDFATMHQSTSYRDFLPEVLDELGEQIAKATKAGVHDIIIDPGFGFSKTMEQNYHLLQHLSLLEQFGKPILAGLSRKSMLYKLLEETKDTALNATTAVNMVVLMHGASILRVHDVKEAMECIKIYNQLS